MFTYSISSGTCQFGLSPSTLFTAMSSRRLQPSCPGKMLRHIPTKKKPYARLDPPVGLDFLPGGNYPTASIPYSIFVSMTINVICANHMFFSCAKKHIYKTKQTYLCLDNKKFDVMIIIRFFSWKLLSRMQECFLPKRSELKHLTTSCSRFYTGNLAK